MLTTWHQIKIRNLQATDNATLNETREQRNQRWAGQVPESNIYEDFEPIDHAVWYNEPYDHIDFSSIDQFGMY